MTPGFHKTNSKTTTDLKSISTSCLTWDRSSHCHRAIFHSCLGLTRRGAGAARVLRPGATGTPVWRQISWWLQTVGKTFGV